MNTFYASLASVSGTLMALLFVSIQYHRKLWVQSIVRRTLAQSTLLEFLTPTVVSLSVLLTGLDVLPATRSFIAWCGWRWPAAALPQHFFLWQLVGCLMSMLGLWNVGQFAIVGSKYRDEVKQEALRGPFRLWPLAFVVFVSLLTGAVSGNQSLVAGSLLWQIFSGSIESWWFFIEKGDIPDKPPAAATAQSSNQRDEGGASDLPQRVGGTARERLTDRLNSSFPSVYLTLTSIIQGSVFTLLVAAVAPHLLESHAFDLTHYLLIVATLLIIVAAWNEYMMGALAFVWIPRLPDTVIPFALGVGEIGLVELLLHDTYLWFACAGLVSFVSAWAFSNMYRNANKRSENNIVLCELSRTGPFGISWTAFSTAYCLFAAFVLAGSSVAAFSLFSGPVISSVAFVGVGVPVGLLARSVWYWGVIVNHANK